MAVEILKQAAGAPSAMPAGWTGASRADDGATILWRFLNAGSAGRVLEIAIAPFRPGYTVAAEALTSAGGLRSFPAAPAFETVAPGERRFRAVLPPGFRETACAPVLCFAGQRISPPLCLDRSAIEREDQDKPVETGHALWGWSTRYLFTLSAQAQPDVVGPCPDGLRIDWRIENGRIAGPAGAGVVLPGATDFMRVRTDGVALVDVKACFEMADGARILASYGGALDLGPDGYARARSGQFPPLPPLVVTPRFETADPRWAWINRAMCVGVGRVDTAARTYSFDVRAVEVAGRETNSH